MEGTAEPASTRRPLGRPPLPWLKPGVVAGAAFPAASLALRAASGTLGANPIAETLNQLGLAALVLLVASLACTPARLLFGWTWPLRIRRELGLLAVAYASIHVLVYVVLDQAANLAAIAEDVAERPFITAGAAAFVLLLPLAYTSTNASVRRLGFARWQRLHRLAYAAAALAALHFLWRVKVDVTQPLLYAAILAALLAVRIIVRRSRRQGNTRAGEG